MKSLAFRSPLICLVLLAALTSASLAEPHRVLPEGTLPNDARLGELTTLGDNNDDYFPFTPPESAEAWETRAGRLHRQLLVANGLWPMPTKTPANAVVHGKVDRAEYTVEKVYLESFPGHFVTGNLYRPKGREGKLPGVLCPHGHWANGRFYQAPEATFKKQLETGAEKFDDSGRYPLQARCVQLARMGCVVFHYDMVGYADSVQLAHRPGLRDGMNTAENWGYFSPQAEVRLQHMMGLQTYNSIRSLDWFIDLPYVDSKRIAVTGASGGGTQTFILSALDKRVTVAVPAVMVSGRMQGGCTCENASYLRVGTGNIEIAGLIAPRPLGMTSCGGDWTQNMEEMGFPQLKQLYGLLGVGDLVTGWHFEQFPHNYNFCSRNVMYDWLNLHLKLGIKEPIEEQDFEPLSREEMTVWDDDHPKPPSGDDYERSLLKWISEDSDRQITKLVSTEAGSRAEYRKVIGGAVDVMIGRRLDDCRVEATVNEERVELDGCRMLKFLARNTVAGEELPGVVLVPEDGKREAVIWIHENGKAGLFGEDGQPKPEVRKLLDGGLAVVGVDLFGQGEFTADGKPIAEARLAGSGRDNWKNYAGYTFGYNYSVFSKRVHDILSIVWLAKYGERPIDTVHLVGLDGAGHWVAAARAQAGDAVARTVVDTAGFRFAEVTSFSDPDFLPGGAKYLDLPGMISLAAPGELWLTGEGGSATLMVAAAYEASGNLDKLTISAGANSDAAVKWLLR